MNRNEKTCHIIECKAACKQARLECKACNGKKAFKYQNLSHLNTNLSKLLHTHYHSKNGK